MFRSLPYAEQDDPMDIQKQCIQGDVKLPRDIDQSMRDLLQCIFTPEPNLRITVKDLMKKQYFKDVDWNELKNKKDLSND